MKTSPSDNIPPVGHACEILDAPSVNISVADCQKKIVRDLFSAIKSRDVQAVIRLTPGIDDLDSHFDEDCNERPLLLAARYDLPVAAFQVLLERSNPQLAGANGATPLILVACGTEPYSADLMRLLLPLSDPRALCGANSALRHAINAYSYSAGSTEIISLLLPVSDLTQMDMDGRAPLAQARRVNLGKDAELILGEMARRESEELARSAGSSISMNSRIPRL